ncbi:MAG: bifunctional heptose 7-phosphate kinase/heptose 1-phosphate adenyltransferase, partial [Acetobacteraceae bacterium]
MKTDLAAGTGQAANDIELADRVRLFPNARVAVLGDVILDRYVTGSVHRLSPEAPIPVLRPNANRSTLGGAANVALNIATLGGQTLLIGVIGDDAAGAETMALVEAADGIACRLVVAPGRPTTAKTRFLAGSHQLLRLDEETTEPLPADIAAALLARFQAALDWADVVVLSDYAKGVLC